jgi:hypothetical protein
MVEETGVTSSRGERLRHYMVSARSLMFRLHTPVFHVFYPTFPFCLGLHDGVLAARLAAQMPKQAGYIEIYSHDHFSSVYFQIRVLADLI